MLLGPVNSLVLKEVILSNVIVDILFFVFLDVCSVSLVMKFLPVSEMQVAMLDSPVENFYK